jgi:hypothetical protein
MGFVHPNAALRVVRILKQEIKFAGLFSDDGTANFARDMHRI